VSTPISIPNLAIKTKHGTQLAIYSFLYKIISSESPTVFKIPSSKWRIPTPPTIARPNATQYVYFKPNFEKIKPPNTSAMASEIAQYMLLVKILPWRYLS
jgi:hypothetical protein